VKSTLSARMSSAGSRHPRGDGMGWGAADGGFGVASAVHNVPTEVTVLGPAKVSRARAVTRYCTSTGSVSAPVGDRQVILTAKLRCPLRHGNWLSFCRGLVA